ncbi:MAG: hypothetical protein PX483_08355 [Nostocales cyanobacterium LE14-WE4]|nr:hypothetical protein [Anabaena sp. 49633_E8]MDJ0500854.1 hypothetical protein [Nostocales cyanobacterium LE14-WE4]
MTIFSLDELKNLVQNPEYPCVSLYLPMEKLCYVVDSALHKKLRGEKAPLILAGVEYLLPIYRQANTYPYLAETGITGNAEILKMQELNHAAWEIVNPLFQKEYEDLMAVYVQLSGEESNKIANDIKAIK